MQLKERLEIDPLTGNSTTKLVTKVLGMPTETKNNLQNSFEIPVKDRANRALRRFL